MDQLFSSLLLLLALLNPFLVIVYLHDLVRRLGPHQFRRVLLRGSAIASAVFCAFAVAGDAIFSTLIQAEFASFQVFGGIVFLLIGLKFVFNGPRAIELLRGDSRHVAGAVAMPVMIGPGTISASLIVGERHDPLIACSVVIVAVATSGGIIVGLKMLHDYVLPRREDLIEHYVEITGRITALYVGTVSVEMIMRGLQAWSAKFSVG